MLQAAFAACLRACFLQRKHTTPTPNRMPQLSKGKSHDCGQHLPPTNGIDWTPCSPLDSLEFQTCTIYLCSQMKSVF